MTHDVTARAGILRTGAVTRGARYSITMRVYLVHHADAVGPDVDPQRPLSALGRTQAAALADRVRGAGFAPASIWHSGKLRARQTAEYFLQTCNPFAEFRMVRGLRPDDPPDWMRDPRPKTLKFPSMISVNRPPFG